LDDGKVPGDGRAKMDVIVGIPACLIEVSGHKRHDTPARYAEALLGAAGAVPIIIPPLGEAELAVLDRIDGLLIPGSPSNVHPSQYDGGDSKTPELHDVARDATTLPLIRAAIARGVPVLAICRGIQELNVALGGTLHQQVHELDGRLDHRGGPGTLEQRYGPKHPIALTGELARIVGADTVMVNSLHGQAIGRPAVGLVVEALAADGTIEAVRVASARGFALGVQWHPEWGFGTNPASLAIFGAFGAACRAYRHGINRKAA
jgi:putative glutamine amidotransferase